MIRVPMTQAQFDAAAAKVEAAQGVYLTGHSGDLQRSGVTAHYEFDGDELTVDVVKKPMLIPLSYVEGQIKQWLGVE